MPSSLHSQVRLGRVGRAPHLALGCAHAYYRQMHSFEFHRMIAAEGVSASIRRLRSPSRDGDLRKQVLVLCWKEFERCPRDEYQHLRVARKPDEEAFTYAHAEFHHCRDECKYLEVGKTGCTTCARESYLPVRSNLKMNYVQVSKLFRNQLNCSRWKRNTRRCRS